MILKDHVTKREEWGFTYSDKTTAIALEVLALVNAHRMPLNNNSVALGNEAISIH